VRALYARDPDFRRIFAPALEQLDKDHTPASAAAAWVVTGEERYAGLAARLLTEAPITSSGPGVYSNLWSFALALDWLYGHPALSGGALGRAVRRLGERLATELAYLDGDYMALWHGRNQAANGALAAALALGDHPEHAPKLPRALAHYAEALRALHASEGWPEGPSYWIYNRALPYALAADCFLTATGQESLAGIPLREVMRRIGLWSIYQYGPNGVFEPYGDSVGSLRLGETGYWEATLDYFARLSRDPALAAGADWFRARSPNPYGRRPVHWWAALAYDPSHRPRRDYHPARPELWLRRKLPQAMLFGRDTLGAAFFRGAWGDPDELFASIKAGDLLAHHDHYNAGAFSFQLGGLLAPQTGVYGASAYDGAYRLGYAVQTVASNALLILNPGETARALLTQKSGAWKTLSGGQRVIRPTGFDCLSLDHFRRQLNAGPRLERATITAFESIPGRSDYLAADLTAAYNSTRYAEPGAEPKVSLVTRQFLYLRPERAFVVFDRIETTRPGFVPKFVLHAMSKPASQGETLLRGASPEDGILATSGRTLTTTHERGRLTQRIVLPSQARTLKIGGPGFSGWIEDPGVNLTPDPGKGAASPKPAGLWRIEVESTAPTTSHRFLNVLLPRLAADPSPLPPVEVVEAGPAATAVRIGGSLAVLARDEGFLDQFEVDLPAPLDAWICDLRPGAVYRAAGRRARASREGVLLLRWPKGRLRLSPTGE
jgi:hypothetical protein